jgi:hypothetical protein
VKLQSKIIAGALVAIALVVFGWCEHRSGVKAGAVDQKLEANAVSVKQNRAAAVVVQKAADVEVKKSAIVRITYRAARAKVEVKGDTVISDGQSIVLPAVANLIKVSDTLAVQDSVTIEKTGASKAAVDSLVSSLDGRVDLLQEVKKPRIGMKTGIAIGVVGTVGVVYIGIKIIRALAHK